MARRKWIMEAPKGGENEAVIEGTYYWPEPQSVTDAAGAERVAYTIDVTNAAHVDVLKRHGFSVLTEIEQLPPPTSYGLIDYPEMGRTELIRALHERGIAFDRDGGRDGMELAAQSWNDMRRGRITSAPKPALDLGGHGRQVAPPAAAQLAKADWVDPLVAAEPDIPTMKIAALRKLLDDAAVAYNPATPIAGLRNVAKREIARRQGEARAAG